MKTKQVTKNTPDGRKELTLQEDGTILFKDAAGRPVAILTVKTLSAIQQLTDEDWKFEKTRADLNEEFDKLPVGTRFRLSAENYGYLKVSATEIKEAWYPDGVNPTWSIKQTFRSRRYNEDAIKAGITVIKDDREDVRARDTVRMALTDGQTVIGVVDNESDAHFIDEDGVSDWLNINSRQVSWVEKVEI